MGCTSSSDQPVMPTMVGEYSGSVDKSQVSYGVEFINNSGGTNITVYYVENGQEIECKTLANGEKWYIDSKKIGLQYRCKTTQGQLVGNYTSQKGFRSHSLSFQQPVAQPVATMEYQSWFTFFNSSPYSVKLIWMQMPGMPAIAPTLVQPGVLFQVQTSYGQQFMVLRAVDNMYMFSAVASLVLVQRAWTVVQVKQNFAQQQGSNTRVTVRGNEADKYACERHYTRKQVKETWLDDLFIGVFVAVAILASLDEFPDVDINIQDIEVPEIPEEMMCNIGDLFNGAGDVVGSAFDAAGNMIQDIDLGDIGENIAGAAQAAGGAVGEAAGGLADGAQDLAGNVDVDGLRDGAAGVANGARDAAGNLIEGVDMDGLRDGAGAAAGGARDAAGNLVDGAGNIIEGVDVDGIRDGVAGAAGGARDAAGNLIEGVDVDGLRDGVAGAAGGARDAAGNLIEGVDVDGLRDGAAGAAEGARDAAGNLIEGVDTDAIRDGAGAAAEGAQEGLGNLAEGAQDAIGDIDMSGAQEAAGGFLEQAGEAMGGLLEGAKDMIGNIDFGGAMEAIQDKMGDVEMPDMDDIDV